jgi:hypothetical protein
LLKFYSEYPPDRKDDPYAYVTSFIFSFSSASSLIRFLAHFSLELVSASGLVLLVEVCAAARRVVAAKPAKMTMTVCRLHPNPLWRRRLILACVRCRLRSNSSCCSNINNSKKLPPPLQRLCHHNLHRLPMFKMRLWPVNRITLFLALRINTHRQKNP